MKATPRQKLSRALQMEGGNVAQLSRALGMGDANSKGYKRLSRVIKGTTEKVDAAILEAVDRYLAAAPEGNGFATSNPRELDSLGRRPSRGDIRSGPHQDSATNGEQEIMRFSAGDGAAGSPIVRSRAELEVTTGMRAEGLEPIFVEGDSMEPEIRANSWAWIRPQATIDGPGIYAVQLDSHFLVKRFDVRFGGVLRVSGADEARYPPEEWEPLAEAETANMYRSMSTRRSGTLHVRGRVVAYTRVT
jgi:phage repressor protein C with HTH and peptisase S24 domain